MDNYNRPLYDPRNPLSPNNHTAWRDLERQRAAQNNPYSHMVGNTNQHLYNRAPAPAPQKTGPALTLKQVAIAWLVCATAGTGLMYTIEKVWGDEQGMPARPEAATLSIEMTGR